LCQIKNYVIVKKKHTMSRFSYGDKRLMNAVFTQQRPIIAYDWQEKCSRGAPSTAIGA